MLKLIPSWDLKEHPIIIIVIKNHEGKISIEFPESANLEKSYFNRQRNPFSFYMVTFWVTGLIPFERYVTLYTHDEEVLVRILKLCLQLRFYQSTFMGTGTLFTFTVLRLVTASKPKFNFSCCMAFSKQYFLLLM